MTEDEKRRRNYIIAGTGGAFLLPLAGVIGAVLFYSREDREAAWWLLAGAIVGIFGYLLLLGAL